MEFKKEKIKFVLLSIFGGGIKGIIPAKVISHIEEKMREISGNSELKIAEKLDLLSGTSTGGIIALSLAMEGENKTPALNASSVLDLYLTKGSKIFYHSPEYVIRSMFGLDEAKFPEKSLESVLEEYFQDRTLLNLVKPVLVAAHNIKTGSLFFFTSHDISKTGRNFYLKDAARATSAAPTLFRPAKITSIPPVDGMPEDYTMIDGGVFANNPVLCAFVEALKINPELKPENILTISLGTGKADRTINEDRVAESGALDWLPYILDILMNDAVDLPDYQLKQIYNLSGCPENYIHIDCVLDREKNEVDNVTDIYFEYLLDRANVAIRRNADTIQRLAEFLVQRR